MTELRGGPLDGKTVVPDEAPAVLTFRERHRRQVIEHYYSLDGEYIGRSHHQPRRSAWRRIVAWWGPR